MWSITHVHQCKEDQRLFSHSLRTTRRQFEDFATVSSNVASAFLYADLDLDEHVDDCVYIAALPAMKCGADNVFKMKKAMSALRRAPCQCVQH